MRLFHLILCFHIVEKLGNSQAGRGEMAVIKNESISFRSDLGIIRTWTVFPFVSSSNVTSIIKDDVMKFENDVGDTGETEETVGPPEDAPGGFKDYIPVGGSSLQVQQPEETEEKKVGDAAHVQADGSHSVSLEMEHRTEISGNAVEMYKIKVEQDKETTTQACGELGVMKGVNVTKNGPNGLTVEWEGPDAQDCLDHYLIQYYTLEFPHALTNKTANSSVQHTELTNLTACTKYTVSVSAVSTFGDVGEGMTWTGSTDEEDVEAPRIIGVSVSGSEGLTVKWEGPDIQSCMDYYLIQYHPLNDSSPSEEKRENKSVQQTELTDLTPCTLYTVNVTGISVSQATGEPASWSGFTGEEELIPPRILSVTASGPNTLSLQWEGRSTETCLDYYLIQYYPVDNPISVKNKTEYKTVQETVLSDLTAPTQYRVYVSAVSILGSMMKSEYWIITTREEAESFPVAAVVGPLVPLIIIVIVILAYYKRNVIRKYIPRRNIRRRNAREEIEIRVGSVTNRPIAQHVFPQECDRLLSTFALNAEYKELVEVCHQKANFSTSDATSPGNKVKNRYSDILPFDHTRVKITVDGNFARMTDYINASYITGYSQKVEYIAAQGPQENTCNDFWQMIWERGVSVIIMLTEIRENGKVKCFQYWQNETGYYRYGHLEVKQLGSSERSEYTIRLFRIRMRGFPWRNVKQMRYKNWCTSDCPEDTFGLRNFVKEARREYLETEYRGPILVHCSAGVGRTGTFIALDQLLQKVDNDESLDIYGTVLKMRMERCKMVQTQNQYIFIYRSVRDELIQRNKERATIDEENSSVCSSVTGIENIYETVSS